MPGDTLTSNIDRFRETALSCPIPPAVELIGEKWAFLILRGAFNNLKHFEEFQAGLGIARNILSDRLGKLVAGGILERSADATDKRKVIYSLTPKGEAHGKPDVVLADRRDGKPVRKICVLSHDGRPLGLGDMVWVDRESAAEIKTAAE
jgi:DNA-binding HxlR family transcriptional regulator